MLFINLIFSVIVFYAFFVAILKFLPCLGIILKKETEPVIRNDGVNVPNKALLKVFIIAVTLRIILYLFSFVMGLQIYPQEINFLEVFCEVWNKWDATRFISIIENGYNALMPGEVEIYNLAFFPLYPWMVRLFTIIVPNTYLAALIVSTLCYSAAMTVMYALVAGEYGTKIAKLSVILISISPFSFFLGGIMTESIFLFTTIMAWYLIKRKKWFLAAIMGALSAMSRIVGILILIPYIMELIEVNSEEFKNHRYIQGIKRCLKQGFWIFIIPFGLIIYLLVNYYYTGDWFKFMEYQHTKWLHEFCYFGKGLEIIWEKVLLENNTMNHKLVWFAPQALTFSISAILIAMSCKKHRSVYTLYSIVYFVIVTSDTRYMSGCRFMLVLFPLYIMYADYLKDNKFLTMISIMISIIFYITFSYIYFCGGLVM